LLGANSLLQGAVFPCVVALQALWIPRDSTDDIWASRTLGVGAVVVEMLATAAPVSWVPALGSAPRTWKGTTAAVVALGGLLGGCGLLVATVAPRVAAQRRKLPMRALFAAKEVRVALLSALAAGTALGAAEGFLPVPAIQQGMALVRIGDLGLGMVEKRLRSGPHPMDLRRFRQLASTLGPLLSSIGLLALVPGALHRRLWPGLASFCLFFASPLGFGAGFGCSYREVVGSGESRHTITATVALSIHSHTILCAVLLVRSERGCGRRARQPRQHHRCRCRAAGCARVALAWGRVVAGFWRAGGPPAAHGDLVVARVWRRACVIV
jgi:hypothetical protein